MTKNRPPVTLDESIVLVKEAAEGRAKVDEKLEGALEEMEVGK